MDSLKKDIKQLMGRLVVKKVYLRLYDPQG